VSNALFFAIFLDNTFCFVFSTHNNNFLISIQAKARGSNHTGVKTEYLHQIPSGISNTSNPLSIDSALR
jgi:hypothetical protein